jgi:glycosyltransferase involved in cell wall biosynthesis
MDMVITTFLNPSGLSYVGQAFYKCFTRHGMRVVPLWLAMPLADWLDPKLAAEMLAASARPFEQPLQFHAGRADDIIRVKNAKTVVGSIVLEGNRLGPRQIAVLQTLDAVLVPSYFCRNICATSGVPRSKLFYLPYPLDQSIWNPFVHPKEPKGERFRILWMNTCYERKGWDVMLRAFWEEFSADDPVELTMKSYREQGREEHLDILVAKFASELGMNRNTRAPVRIIDAPMAAGDMPGFMKSFDAYVSPHRSEGFGLNPWHAMALGVPVIATDYGGTCDFAKRDTAWLVKLSSYSKPSPQELSIFPHLAGTVWAEPDVADLRRQMRVCLINTVEARKRAEVGAVLVAQNYAEPKILERFKDALDTTAPGAWEQIMPNQAIERLAKQPSPKFESAEKPLRMPEI